MRSRLPYRAGCEGTPKTACMREEGMLHQRATQINKKWYVVGSPRLGLQPYESCALTNCAMNPLETCEEKTGILKYTKRAELAEPLGPCRFRRSSLVC